MEPKFDKYVTINEAESALNALADASGIRRALLTGNIYNLLEGLRAGLQEEDAAHGAKVKELLRVIDENKKDGTDNA